jgi:hypothetical protein
MPLPRPLAAALVLAPALVTAAPPGPRPHVTMRGIYGGVPQEILDSGRRLKEFGVDAVRSTSGISFESHGSLTIR